MEVFTTIFLVVSDPAKLDFVEVVDENGQDQPGLAWLKQTMLKRIAALESRKWFKEGALGE